MRNNKMENKDGIEKNLSVVAEEFKELWKELETLPPRVKMAWSLKRYGELFHVLSNFIGEPIDKLPRFWLYVWPLKYALILWLIFGSLP